MIAGPPNQANVSGAFGHGRIGLTLVGITEKLIGGLVAGETPTVDFRIPSTGMFQRAHPGMKTRSRSLHTMGPQVRFGLGIAGSEPPGVVLDRAKRLDSVDVFDHLWVADERFSRDVWVTLGLLAGKTSNLHLATCVTDPYIRHPALTVSAIASSDEITGGRAALGIGAGISGFGALGITRVSPATAIREAVELMRLL